MALLWCVLVLVGTMFGASVYQRVALIPEWGGALPQSVAQYFGDPRAGQAIDPFWTIAGTLAAYLCFVKAATLRQADR